MNKQSKIDYGVVKTKIWKVLPYGSKSAMLVDVIKNLIQENIDMTITKR